MYRRVKQKRLLSKTVAQRMKKAVLDNSGKVMREIRETRELYQLMLKWSNGKSLTATEKRAVKAQLWDICKTIPALAIFLAPFGSILLPILIKFLPFNILPTAFTEQDYTQEEK
ncbi:MAG: LETM1 domain-containing protein [bacterium]